MAEIIIGVMLIVGLAGAVAMLWLGLKSGKRR